MSGTALGTEQVERTDTPSKDSLLTGFACAFTFSVLLLSLHLLNVQDLVIENYLIDHYKKLPGRTYFSSNSWAKIQKHNGYL